MLADGDHCYALFGLSVASEIPMPELVAAAPCKSADVHIRLGSIPRDGEEPLGLSLRDGGALLNIAEAGRYWMEDGREMVVEPVPGGSALNLRLFLLGSAFAALLHQRGLLPLHANAVVIEGRAIGFMGHPGAGKSTLAAWFHDRGLAVLADDVCVVARDAQGNPIAQPGIPRLRLWREALEKSGRTAEDYERAFDGMDKYTVPTAAGAQAPVPLSHLYVLGRAGDSDGPAVTRLQGSAAVEALVANTYRGSYVSMMGQTGQHLLACAALAQSVPVFSARRFWGFDDFDAEAVRLETHAREQILAVLSN